MIVAFDTSTRRTGWCRGEPGGPVRFGSFAVPEHARHNLGMLLNEWAIRAHPLIVGCERVYFEAPIHPQQTTQLTTLRQLYSIAAHVEFLAFHAGADAVEVDSGSMKRLLYGKAGAKPDNAEEHAAAWGVPVRNNDEADAFGVYLYALEKEFPHAFKRWLTIRKQSAPVAFVARPKKPSKGLRTPQRQRGKKSSRPEPTLL